MKATKICLINAGVRTLYNSLVSPPMGLLYIAAYLRTKFNVRILIINQKLHNLSDDELVKKVVDFNADIVGLSAMTPSSYCLSSLSRLLKERLKDLLVIAGGAHISGAGASALKGTKIDLAVQGEGEIVFGMILERYLAKSGFSDIPGLIHRDKDRIITNNGKTPLIEDIDSLPFPAYDLIDLPEYWSLQSMLPVPRRKYISIFSSRGCPYSCKYCHRIFENRYRTHSAKRIVDEIEYYQKKYGLSEIEFLDDIFNLDHNRLIEFCELIIKRNIKIKIAFPNGVRTDIFSKDEIDALTEAGMYIASFALESGSKRIQKSAGKGLDISKYLENVEYAVKKGVFANGFAMFGFPGETAAQMQKTIDVACSSKLHTISFFTVTPYPGSVFYDELIKQDANLIDNIDFRDFTSCHAKVNLSNEPDNILLYYQRKANRQFYFNPARAVRILRDHPQPHLLPLYLPEFMKRVTKGFASGGSADGQTPGV